MTSPVTIAPCRSDSPRSTARHVKRGRPRKPRGENLEGLHGAMIFARIWHLLGGKRRRPTSTHMFRQAQRLRDEGRLQDANDLVEAALRREPGNVVGHLLAGSLHMALRETGQARTSFERVLALDATQPRALLGLARIALEEGETAACRELLEIARGLTVDASSKRAATPNDALRTERLRLPAECREAMFMQSDASLVFAEPRGPRSEAVAAGAVKLARVATAMLERAGFGPLRHAVIEGPAETTYVRADDTALLTLAFDYDVKAESAVAHLERVWGSCRSEIA